LKWVYGDNYHSWTAATTPQNAQIGAQFRNIAENAWEPGSSWEEIVSAADFYDWLRNPMRELLFAGDSNAGCGAKARSSPNNDMGSLNPLLCTMWKKAHVWNVVGCQLRQVRVKPTPYADVPDGLDKFPYMNGITEIYPDFTVDKTRRSAPGIPAKASQSRKTIWMTHSRTRLKSR